MSEADLQLPKSEIKSRMKESKEDAKSRKYPHEGEVDGYQFVLDNFNDVETILNEVSTATIRKNKWYDRLNKALGIPLLSVYIQNKAWYYDGYAMAMLACLDVHTHTRSDESGERTTLRDDNTKEVIRVLC